MSVRKYITEFGLRMNTSRMWLLHQDQLENLKNSDEFKIDPPHIYVVVRQPKVSIDTVFYINDEILRISFNIQQQDTLRTESFRVPISPEVPKLELDCPYPYTEYILKDSQGNKHMGGKAAILLLQQINSFQGLDLPSQEIDKLDNLQKSLSFEVLYVGQSYGTEGSSTSVDRLINHKTLQKIYFDSSKNFPGKDIWLILCSFEKSIITTTDPKQDEYGVSEAENNKHLFQAANTEVTEKQSINFTEASLIRYFQPEYNKIYKDSFPSTSHTAYSECYELDVNSVAIHLSTQEFFMLHSSQVPPNCDHSAYFNLHSHNERKSMFELAGLTINE